MDKQFRDLDDGILVRGRQRFGAMLGIISHIRQASYEVVAVSSDTGIPEVGDTYELDAVYCREVYQKKRTVAVTEIAGVPGMRLHPLYGSIPCEFYISAPIIVSGEVWGTLNFTSLEKRATPFSDEDIRYIEAQAARISKRLSPTA